VDLTPQCQTFPQGKRIYNRGLLTFINMLAAVVWHPANGGNGGVTAGRWLLLYRSGNGGDAMAAQFRNLIFEGGGVKGIALIEEGITGAERYFTWFENPDETPVNRIESIVKRPVPSGT